MISEDELNELMCSEDSVEVLEALGIDISFLQTLQVMTFEEPDTTVAIPAILEQMLACRRDLPVTVKHLILGQHLTIWMLGNKILQHEKRMEKQFSFQIELLLKRFKALSHQMSSA